MHFWLTNNGVLGQVVMLNCRLWSEFLRPVSLLLAVAARYRLCLTIFVTELAVAG
jgi:hypothetical protein